MATVKFDKSVKYKGERHLAHVVFEVDDADVPALKKAGATVISVSSAQEQKQEPQEQKQEDNSQLREDLLGYSVAQLTEFAKQRGIDLQGKTRKADIYNIIVASLN